MARDTDTTDRSSGRQADAERYHAAAEATLDQLDWCIAYLHRIGKSPIAAVLARNRSEIRRREGCRGGPSPGSLRGDRWTARRRLRPAQGGLTGLGSVLRRLF